MKEVDVVVIGAGAAGCFAAIQVAHHFPKASIIILERGKKPLAKVKISGGGRCNVTNVVSEPSELSRNYPRGERFLKKVFYQFSSNDMKIWLEQKGIPLKLYPDGCYFPLSNDSQTIIDCFLHELKRANCPILLEHRVESIHLEETEKSNSKKWIVESSQGVFCSKSVIVTTGGQPKASGFDMLNKIEISYISPLPSLFTFNMPNEPIRNLMGIVTENASVKIAGEKWNSSGPLLITHWGMSGPVVLKCSAFGARILADKNYQATILVNWTGSLKQEEVQLLIKASANSNKYISNTPLFEIKSRLWDFLIEKSGISLTTKWSELGPKQLNKFSEILVTDAYRMEGKTTFKEEFVTAGGIDLSEINVQTMESKKHSGLFFAGEVMDIDGITGGFNFQSAWTTGYIAGKSALLNR